MSRRENKNTDRNRTPTVIRQDVSPLTLSDSLILCFGAFLFTTVIFLIIYAIYLRLK